MELIATRIGEGSVRVALLDNERMIASTFSIATLREEDAQYELAQYLVRNVRPQAGPHVVLQVANMIADNIRRFN